MKPKKSFLFMHDHSVVKTRASLQSLIQGHQLDRAKMVLFPYTPSTLGYIAVEGEYLSDLKFTSAEMTYQLCTRKDEIKMDNPQKHSPYHTSEDYMTGRIWRYYPVTIQVNTIEDFYHMLMNIFLYSDIGLIQQNNTESNNWVDFIDLEQCRIRIFDHGKIFQEYEFSYREVNLPFDEPNIEIVADDIMKQFGFVDTSWRSGYGTKPCVIWKRGDRLHWNQVAKLELTEDIHRVFYPWNGAFLGMTMPEYDVALSITHTDVYVHLMHSGVELEEPTQSEMQYCSFSAYYNIPRWFVNGDGTSLTEEAYDIIAPNATDLKTFELYDAMDTFILLEELGTAMKVFEECYKALCAVERGRNIEEFPWTAIILVEFKSELSLSKPTDQFVNIVTDNYQSELPTAKELLLLLQGLDKGLSLDDE